MMVEVPMCGCRDVEVSRCRGVECSWLGRLVVECGCLARRKEGADDVVEDAVEGDVEGDVEGESKEMSKGMSRGWGPVVVSCGRVLESGCRILWSSAGVRLSHPVVGSWSPHIGPL
jgi:hypothetical protein